MGQHDISQITDNARMRAFTKALLEDVLALERIQEAGLIEEGVRRIGAEQELFLVDSSMRPVPVAFKALERLGNDGFAPELALYNLEINLTPQSLGGDCLSRMERELTEQIARVREVTRELGAQVVMVGILPTLDTSHLGLDSMSPIPRFHQLNRVMSEARGGDFHTYIKGVDELQVRHDHVMLEACNTSFQIHFQVGSKDFAKLYNLAQLVTAPVLAAAVNSPVFLQHRLWKETRVALFQQSLDARSVSQQARGGRTRVSFGERWIESSVLEIFREDIARFRSLIATDHHDSPIAMLERGEIPPLSALCLHNGTVYRWNRPVYGVSGGKAHLRIENRALPAGPTAVDELANAAFYFGLMSALGEQDVDITQQMRFDDAKANFMAAARYGLKAQLNWLGGTTHTAGELILEHLLPLAREGLAVQAIDDADAERYLGVIEERVRRLRTGAQWILDSLANMAGRASSDNRYRAVTAAIAARQHSNEPVHAWELASLEEAPHWEDSYRTVEQVMTRDVFTVHPEDLVDLAASLMEWEHIRHVPVEDQEGRLVGLVSHRALLRLIGRGASKEGAEPVAVREIMRPDPVTITPDASTLGAIETMKRHRVSCLPVVKEGVLVGIVTERDFIEVAGVLLEEKLREA